MGNIIVDKIAQSALETLAQKMSETFPGKTEDVRIDGEISKKRCTTPAKKNKKNKKQKTIDALRLI